jgi:hypothetical protein
VKGAAVHLPSDGGLSLARRLRALRERHWPDLALTQAQLATALSVRKPVSVPAISSWESTNSPKVPPISRLGDLATFFASRRSVDGSEYRLLREDELTEEERAQRDKLLQELLALRDSALRRSTITVNASVQPATPQPGGPGVWHFSDVGSVTIVCAQVPNDLRQRIPYADPEDPDYVEMYMYADLDALFELHGHIRAANPGSQVNLRLATALMSDDYTSHLVLLGGVDWNVVTRDLLTRLDLPVHQVPYDESPDGSYFAINIGGKSCRFRPRLEGSVLLEDVAHFFRGPNPFNVKRTLSICNGIYGRGTLGAVRALTDSRFSERNEHYLSTRFEGRSAYSILMRVPIVNRAAVTPDWTLAETRLHEWPQDSA